MPLIGDFVDHRWMDAKEILRKQDPDHVRKIESTGRSPQDWLKPTSGLPPRWHNLLAACDELHLLASMVQAAAVGLTPFPYLHGDLSSAEVGQLRNYLKQESTCNECLDWHTRHSGEGRNLGGGAGLHRLAP